MQRRNGKKDRDTRGERDRERKRKTEAKAEGNRETERKVDPARKKTEKLFKQGQSEWTDGVKWELCI